MTHTLEPTLYHNTLGPHEPVLRVQPGDTVKLTTVDARGRDLHGNIVAARPNPMTGPIYVEGAEPGHTLALRFERIRPNRPIGYSSIVLAPNVVDPEYVRELPIEEPWSAEWLVDNEAGIATPIKPERLAGKLTVPLHPMLGCFGVAAERGQAISTGTSGRHGGNMDWNGFVEGVTVYLPVFEPGALLFMGDGHAAQGAGEIVGTGIEISMDVEVTVWIVKEQFATWPRAETPTHLVTVGNARPLDQALQHATSEMHRWLLQTGMDASEACLLLGMAVEYEIANVYNPVYSVVCKLERNYPLIR